MIELNLLPDVKKEFIKAQRTRNTVISLAIVTTIAAGVITVLLATTVYVGQNAFMAVQTDDIKKKETELKNVPEIDKYLTIQNQLAKVDSLHDGKYVYSRAFGYLQQLNPAQPNNVALSSVSLIKETNSLVLKGTARNFEAISVYKTTLENAMLKYGTEGSTETSSTKLFDTVGLTEANLSAPAGGKQLASFTIVLTYPEAAFVNSSQNVSVEVPTLTTSDADRNAPKQIFGAQPEGAQ